MIGNVLLKLNFLWRPCLLPFVATWVYPICVSNRHGRSGNCELGARIKPEVISVVIERPGPCGPSIVSCYTVDIESHHMLLSSRLVRVNRNDTSARLRRRQRTTMSCRKVPLP